MIGVGLLFLVSDQGLFTIRYYKILQDRYNNAKNSKASYVFINSPHIDCMTKGHSNNLY